MEASNAEKIDEKSSEMIEETEEAPSVEMKESVEDSLRQRQGFTSEVFKIEIKGLPKFFNASQAKKLLRNKLNLNPHKIKPCGPKATFMYVNFKNEEDREKAIVVLDGFELKGRKLRAFKAKAATDPYKRSKQEPNDEPEDDRPPEERIKSAVCKLGHLDYDEQIKQKEAEVVKLMRKLKFDFRDNLNAELRDKVNVDEIAVVEPFIRSPMVDGYRNKCEFSIGPHPMTKEVTVGFRLSSYRQGSVSVVGVDSVPVVSDLMKKVVKHFDAFVKKSKYAAYDNVSQQGTWRQLTVRTSRSGELLVWIVAHPQNLSEEEKTALKKELTDYFAEAPDCKVSSLHIQFFDRKQKDLPDPPVETLHGTDTITEQLFNLKFRISPQAFFQVNTLGAELLYKAAGDIANVDDSTVLLDVCCGTGTIGLCLADRCKLLYGIEIVAEAVEDAKKNAMENNITNGNFIAGRCEFAMVDILKRHNSEKIVAIVDPPRAGLHPKAVHALRASSVQTLVYISCDAKAAMANFLSLGRPASNTMPGAPFVPKKVIPVDLFPHTNHFELVILFERLNVAE